MNDRVTTVMVGIVLVVTIVLLFLLIAMSVLIVSDDLDDVVHSNAGVFGGTSIDPLPPAQGRGPKAEPNGDVGQIG